MTTLVGVALGLVLVGALLRIFENRFIYFPPRFPDGFAPPENYGLRAEEVWITTQDGVRLNAWFVPAESAKVILVFHGNAENIGHGLGRLKVLSRLGVNLLALDYRGYGKSEGSPDESGVYRDADAAYRYAVEARRFRPQDVVVYGQSLGGAVAIDLAARHESGGLIVESSFTSAREMARRTFRIPFFEYLPKSRFDSVTKITRVRTPVLIVHGNRDTVIPFAMGEALYRAAPEPKTFLPVEGAGHDDVFIAGGAPYVEALKKLVAAKEQ